MWRRAALLCGFNIRRQCAIHGSLLWPPTYYVDSGSQHNTSGGHPGIYTSARTHKHKVFVANYVRHVSSSGGSKSQAREYFPTKELVLALGETKFQWGNTCGRLV